MPGYDQNAPSHSTGGGANTESTPTGEPRGEWVSVRAIAWVLDDAPCPAKLLPVLTAIARRCDEHGRGSRKGDLLVDEWMRARLSSGKPWPPEPAWLPSKAGHGKS